MTVLKASFLTPLLLVSALSGCAVMNAQECRTDSPEQLGLQDGSNGYTLARLQSRVQACAKYGVPFNEQAWMQGYRQGLAEFCTPQGGEATGLSGQSYVPGTCPAASEPDFLAAYRPAYRLYRVQSCYNRWRGGWGWGWGSPWGWGGPPPAFGC
ncbi:DUF2799 domain-containing protein [Laribacter hongkongensis]|uniref:DUF2799 domain-containing protein n=1 Tax=Laribacter hongkongensis TaxID=168471 RepID=UPI001EFC2E1D|nr:DUF2799 domain-containing protein [Laribacter hongkongensis]MCG9052479.1 DUF2799 domain-containing protein [Laribacter hongkongensis]